MKMAPYDFMSVFFNGFILMVGFALFFLGKSHSDYILVYTGLVITIMGFIGMKQIGE